jgi:hypothetical protein
MITDETLKTWNRKDLRKKIIELSDLNAGYEEQLGRLISERDNLVENLKLAKAGLAQTEKARKYEQDAKEILQVDNRRLQEEIKLSQSNKNISLILQEFGSRTKNQFRKIFKKS